MGPAVYNSWPYWDINHRRSFSNLREGIHVPGYTGYMPQSKYEYGDRFTVINEKLLGSQIIRKPLPPIPPKPKSGVRNPPADDGLHKYLPGMMAGYTGYIPHRLYNYGENYHDDCNTCIKQLQQDKVRSQETLDDVKTHVNKSIQLKPIANTQEVLERLQRYSTSTNTLELEGSKKRPFLEAPKVGYTGYVPRKGVTDIALGVRRSAADKLALKSFQDAQNHQKNLDEQPVDLNAAVDDTPNWVLERRRIYTPNGLKPKFTGFIPHRRFVYGKTYGNMTREMSVCSHRKNTYGHHNTERNREN